MASVFLSYQREDSAGYAGRLSEHLAGVFGADLEEALREHHPFRSSRRARRVGNRLHTVEIGRGQGHGRLGVGFTSPGGL